MSLQHTQLVMLWGGGAVATGTGSINANQTITPANQLQTETVAVGSLRRTISGPNAGGRFSLQVFVDSAGGAGSAVTVWYSNLAAPSVADDTAWTQDTTVGSIVIDTTASKFANVGNVDAQWIMVKATAVASTANIRVIARVEGITHGPGVDA